PLVDALEILPRLWGQNDVARFEWLALAVLRIFGAELDPADRCAGGRAQADEELPLGRLRHRRGQQIGERCRHCNAEQLGSLVWHSKAPVPEHGAIFPTKTFNRREIDRAFLRTTKVKAETNISKVFCEIWDNPIMYSFAKMQCISVATL